MTSLVYSFNKRVMPSLMLLLLLLFSFFRLLLLLAMFMISCSMSTSEEREVSTAAVAPPSSLQPDLPSPTSIQLYHWAKRRSSIWWEISPVTLRAAFSPFSILYLRDATA